VSDPPRQLVRTTRIHTAVLALLGTAVLSLGPLFFYPYSFLGTIPIVLVIVLLIVAQWRGTFHRSQPGAVVAGLHQLFVALLAAMAFSVNILLIFVWIPAPLLVLGSLIVGYTSYWMAWQNWMWVQRLRGTTEDALPVPRTLSLTQMMIVVGAVSIVCGLAAMVKHSIQ